MLENMESGTQGCVCVGFSPNITFCIQDKNGIPLPHFFAVLL
jgi:hypothetical protein